jgi:glycosyltransferase involved in cell wall biosynthesis
MREWLDDGVNGRLVAPAAGEDGLARAMASMLDRPDECARMGKQALATSRRLTLALHVEHLEGVLQRAV